MRNRSQWPWNSAQPRFIVLATKRSARTEGAGGCGLSWVRYKTVGARGNVAPRTGPDFGPALLLRGSANLLTHYAQRALPLQKRIRFPTFKRGLVYAKEFRNMERATRVAKNRRLRWPRDGELPCDPYRPLWKQARLRAGADGPWGARDKKSQQARRATTRRN